MGDVRNDGRRGLTGTLIEGSIGLKHRNLGKRRAWRQGLCCQTPHRGIKSKNTLGNEMLKGVEAMKFRTTFILASLVASVMTIPVSSDAAGPQIRARFSYDGLANCENPEFSHPWRRNRRPVRRPQRNSRYEHHRGRKGAVPGDLGRCSDSRAGRLC